MTLVILGIDALDPELVNPDDHSNLILEDYKNIETLVSSSGEPSTHELWPTIITGLTPAEHGLQLDDGVAWSNPLLDLGSRFGGYVLPDWVQTKVGAWLLNQTSEDAFRVPASYYDGHVSTVFDGTESLEIGIPNYVVNPDSEDREHQIRRSMGDLFERDPEAKGGHKSTDIQSFYERCMEMAMIRIARVRRGLRSRQYELVFGYTSGLDLIGHVSHARPEVQAQAYDELDQFVGELRSDLRDDDELVLLSDHGLQDGLHTEQAMISATDPTIIDNVGSVLDVRSAIESELSRNDHTPNENRWQLNNRQMYSNTVRDQLEKLGYM
jgi:predicted AlkP superfamily pyrophosphatase or phosphodiesterase